MVVGESRVCTLSCVGRAPSPATVDSTCGPSFAEKNLGFRFCRPKSDAHPGPFAGEGARATFEHKGKGQSGFSDWPLF